MMMMTMVMSQSGLGPPGIFWDLCPCHPATLRVGHCPGKDPSAAQFLCLGQDEQPESLSLSQQEHKCTQLINLINQTVN